jgi:membrane carboxypeptidase/penicillin-binding protein PbpC
VGDPTVEHRADSDRVFDGSRNILDCAHRDKAVMSQMELFTQPPKLRLFGLRPALIKIHTDLLLIHSRVEVWAALYPSELTPLEKLVIVLEDRRFMKHLGFDLKSVIRELFKALTFRRHGGASTIDMQFIRTVTGYNEMTISRKLYEILLSILIQYRYSKVVILRSYLKCAYFGSRIIGVDKASKKMFGVAADALTNEQAALLAAMLVYPRPLSGHAAWSLRVRRRANYGMSVYIANKQRFDKLTC